MSSDEGRKCKLNHRDHVDETFTFKFFGEAVHYSEDGEGHNITMAFVESEKGEIIKINPDQVRFIN